MKRLVTLALAVALGCGKAEMPSTQGPAGGRAASTAVMPSELNRYTGQLPTGVEAAAQRALLARLQADPQPLFDTALTGIKESLPALVGVEAAHQATITLDKDGLTTLGLGRWRVGGWYSGLVNGK